MTSDQHISVHKTELQLFSVTGLNKHTWLSTKFKDLAQEDEVFKVKTN